MPPPPRPRKETKGTSTLAAIHASPSGGGDIRGGYDIRGKVMRGGRTIGVGRKVIDMYEGYKEGQGRGGGGGT